MSRRVGLKQLLGLLAEKKSTMLANKQSCFDQGLRGAQMKSGGEGGGCGDVERGLKLDMSVIRSPEQRKQGKLGR